MSLLKVTFVAIVITHNRNQLKLGSATERQSLAFSEQATRLTLAFTATQPW